MTNPSTPDREQVAREVLEPRLLEQPEHCPGAYVMHFYCKYENPAHPTHGRCGARGQIFMEEADQVETRGEALRQMRAAGWIYHRDGTATCPTCAAALRTLSHSREQRDAG